MGKAAAAEDPNPPRAARSWLVGGVALGDLPPPSSRVGLPPKGLVAGVGTIAGPAMEAEAAPGLPERPDAMAELPVDPEGWTPANRVHPLGKLGTWSSIGGQGRGLGSLPIPHFNFAFMRWSKITNADVRIKHMHVFVTMHNQKVL